MFKHYGNWLLAGALCAMAMWIFFKTAHASDEPQYGQLARGEYLVNTVAGCFNCHGQRDWMRYSGPVKPESRGRGRTVKTFGGAGVYAPNITPAELAPWPEETWLAALIGDGSPAARAHGGFAGFDYSELAIEDALAIVAYMRALPAIEQPTSYQRKAVAPWRSERAKTAPPREDAVAYGRYLVLLGGCRGCHGESLSGGRELLRPDGSPVAAANLTPGPNTWVGTVDRQRFIAGFQRFGHKGLADQPMPEGAPNTPMPYAQFANLSAADLGAIYDYLMVLEPIPNNE